VKIKFEDITTDDLESVTPEELDQAVAAALSSAVAGGPLPIAIDDTDYGSGITMASGSVLRATRYKMPTGNELHKIWFGSDS
jgi:hypothetical protein